MAREAISPSVLTWAKVISLLAKRPCSMQYLTEQTGLTRTTAARYIRALRQEGICHVAVWTKSKAGRLTVPNHALGSAMDAPRRVKTRAQIVRDWKSNRKEKK